MTGQPHRAGWLFVRAEELGRVFTRLTVAEAESAGEEEHEGQTDGA